MTPGHPSPIPAPAAGWRALVIAQAAWHDALHQRLPGVIVLTAVGLVLGVQWLREFNFGADELKLTADFGFGTMGFFGGVLTIAAGAQLFYGEIEQRTALAVLAKPVGRGEFILGKFVALAGIAAVFCALLTTVLAGVLWVRGSALALDPEALAGASAVALGPLAVTAFAQWLKLVLLAALTLLVASFARSQLFTVTMGFLIWVACELQYVAQEAAARGGTALSRAAAALIGGMLPNFRFFDFAAESAGALEGAHLLRLTLYSAGYATVACALATFSFRRREI